MDTRALLKQFIAYELVGQRDLVLNDDDDLLLSGLVDSLGVVRLIAYIEEELRVPVPPGDVTIENFGTVGAIADYLATQQAA